MLKIAHLYPKLLNLYGDKGNILTLCQRLSWRGISFEVNEIDIKEHDKKLSDYHLFFIGGGQDSQQELVALDLLTRENELAYVLNSGAVMLAICGGYQLLGHSYETSDGCAIAGLGIIDVTTQAKAREKNTKQDRLIGNVTAELLVENLQGKTLVGFENHAGRTYIKSGSKLTKPLAKIISGFGNNGEDGYEGAIHNNIFGTYLHGSLLPKNPHLADELILRALQYSKHEYLQSHHSLEGLDDSLENLAHNYALKL